MSATQQPSRIPRPAEQSDESDTAADAGAGTAKQLRTVNAELERHLKNYPEDVLKSATATQRKLHNSIDTDTAGPHPALVFSPIRGWNTAKERDAKDMWAQQKEFWPVPKGQRYLKLWKICLQYGECTPFDIIGVRNSLQYAREVRANGRVGELGSMWSEEFSDQLSKLITHPIWPSNYSGALAHSVGIALQYAIILRADIREPWDPAGETRDPFLKTVRDVSARSRAPMPEIHAEARKIVAARRYPLPLGSLSSIFLALEGIIKKVAQKSRSDDSYTVSTRDLKKLERALDAVSGRTTGNRLLPTEVYHQTAITARPFKPAPAVAQLPRFHKMALVEECRRIIGRQSGHRASVNEEAVVISDGIDSDDIDDNDTKLSRWSQLSDDGDGAFDLPDTGGGFSPPGDVEMVDEGMSTLPPVGLVKTPKAVQPQNVERVLRLPLNFVRIEPKFYPVRKLASQ